MPVDRPVDRPADRPAPPDRLLVLGLGNVLLSDDGLGIAAVSLLERHYQAPDGVSVLDGGTLGLALLPLLEEADDAILVDAVRADAPPGSLVRLDGDAVPPAVRERLSPHQIGVADLLDGVRLRGRSPRRIALLGLVPETLELGVARSAAVEAGIPDLVERIVTEARGMGYAFTPRRLDETRARRSPDDGLARLFGL